MRGAEALTSEIWKVVVKDGDNNLWEVFKVSRTATSMILTKRVVNTINTHVTHHNDGTQHNHHAQIIIADDDSGEPAISEEQNNYIPANELSNVTFELYHAISIDYERLDKKFIPFRDNNSKRKEHVVIVDVRDYENPKNVIECGVFLVAPNHYGKFYEMLKDFQKVRLVPIKEFSPHVVFGFWRT